MIEDIQSITDRCGWRGAERALPTQAHPSQALSYGVAGSRAKGDRLRPSPRRSGWRLLAVRLVAEARPKSRPVDRYGVPKTLGVAGRHRLVTGRARSTTMPGRLHSVTTAAPKAVRPPRRAGSVSMSPSGATLSPADAISESPLGARLTVPVRNGPNPPADGMWRSERFGSDRVPVRVARRACAPGAPVISIPGRKSLARRSLGGGIV
jgi:hypothetical protein